MAGEAGADRWRASPLAMRRWLASELVRLRIATDLTQRDVAVELDCSVGKISYLESGERPVSCEELKDVLLGLYRVPADERESYLAAARIASQTGWWDQWGDEDLPRGDRRYLGIEDGATRLRAFLPSIVHGLLQTPEYTKGILRGYKAIPEVRIARLVELRQVRKSLLTRAEDPLEAHLIFDEAAVTRQVGSVETMKAQLFHIANVTEQLKNVSVQILPFSAGSHGAYFGPFSILDFPSEHDSGLVYVEGLVEARYLEARSDVYKYAALFERLAELALTPAESIRTLQARASWQA